MNTIDICYRAYFQPEVTNLTEAAADMLPKKEYEELTARVDQMAADAFAAGFRLATKLWIEGAR